MRTPHIVKPLRFLKSRIPTLKPNAEQRDIEAFLVASKVYQDARRLADRGDGLAVQNMARAEYSR